jgi:hypothetical protein
MYPCLMILKGRNIVGANVFGSCKPKRICRSTLVSRRRSSRTDIGACPNPSSDIHGPLRSRCSSLGIGGDRLRVHRVQRYPRSRRSRANQCSKPPTAVDLPANKCASSCNYRALRGSELGRTPLHQASLRSPSRSTSSRTKRFAKNLPAAGNQKLNRALLVRWSGQLLSSDQGQAVFVGG